MKPEIWNIVNGYDIGIDESMPPQKKEAILQFIKAITHINPKPQPPEFICKRGHEFVSPLTIGDEESSAEVCPVCKSDNFMLISEMEK